MRVYDLVKKHGWVALQNLNALGINPSYLSHVFFVDQNNPNALDADNGEHGQSWEKPFKTIAYAITRNNAGVDWSPDQGQWHGMNNYIVIGPGHYSENLTACPWACTMIGVGSNLGYPSSEGGVWINPSSDEALVGSMLGTTINNIGFEGNSSAGTCVDITTFNNSAFIHCKFNTNVADFTCLLQIDNAGGSVIRDSVFTSGTTPAAYGIHIDDGAFFGSYIENCIINAATAGILVDSTVDLTGNSWIKGNEIAYPVKGIDLNNESNNLIRVTNNTIMASSDCIEGSVAALTTGNWANQAGTGDWEIAEPA